MNVFFKNKKIEYEWKFLKIININYCKMNKK